MRLRELDSDLFQWAGVHLSECRKSMAVARTATTKVHASYPRLAICRPPSTVSDVSLQFSMGIESKVVRFVPKNRLHLLDRYAADTFAPGCPKFMRIHNRLFEDGIIQLGDLVALTEGEFRSYTRSEEVVAHVHHRLKQMKLDFGLSTPGWTPRIANQ